MNQQDSGGQNPSAPTGLVDAILAGECVAFVGAGFSAAAGLPTWRQLLSSIAEHPEVPASTAEHVVSRILRGTASAFDEAAQALSDTLGRTAFIDLLAARMATSDLPPEMIRRLNWLHGIPFRAILTTNFDGLIDGALATQASYRDVLRSSSPGRWDERFWSQVQLRGAPTLKLHGDLTAAPSRDSIVLTRRDYRTRLYHEAGYATFLRAILSTCTVLYLGFSFEDAYLNELRSETLAVLGHQEASSPVAYAIANDVAASTQTHFRVHEGIELLTFESTGQDFSGFDRWLEAIHAATNAVTRLGSRLDGRRVLWLDPNPEGEIVEPFLRRAAEAANSTFPPLETVATFEEATVALADAAQPFDLIITHWGDGVGERLLSWVRAQDVRSPVLVFAGISSDERKRTALALGAHDYCVQYETLFDRIDHILAPAAATA